MHVSALSRYALQFPACRAGRERGEDGLTRLPVSIQAVQVAGWEIEAVCVQTGEQIEVPTRHTERPHSIPSAASVAVWVGAVVVGARECHQGLFASDRPTAYHCSEPPGINPGWLESAAPARDSRRFLRCGSSLTVVGHLCE